jgi:drug/metabolite transporter (DMT)-like permease
MPLRTLLGLVACNFVWSAHPIMGKLLLGSFPPAQTAWLRYASGLAAYLLAFAATALLRALRPVGRRDPAFMVPRSRRDLMLVLALGGSAFCLSPLLQLTGLVASRATDNALIVAMEPLMTVVIAWAVLRDRVTRLHLLAFAIALAGFALLARPDGSELRPEVAWDPHVVGNLVILLSLVGEALYSTLGRQLVGRYAPTAVFGSALFAGVACLTVGTALIAGLPSMAAVAGMPGRAWVGLLWLGPVGTTLTYLYWMNALTQAPIASLALTLFIQPLFGPIWGFLYLGERLNLSQGVGSALILLAVFSQTWFEIRPRRGQSKKI